MKCYQCRGLGQVKRSCPEKKKSEETSRKVDKNEAFVGNCSWTIDDKEVWFSDTSAIYHMTLYHIKSVLKGRNISFALYYTIHFERSFKDIALHIRN